MSRMLSYRDRVEEVTYDLFFPHDARGTSGYAFDCDEAGVVDTAKLNPLALANFEKCLAASAGEVRTLRSWRTIPAVMRCDCGKKLEIYSHHDVSCGCGRSYNSAGSLLAPRSQWGEETGETAADYDAGVAEGDAGRWA